MNLFGIIAMTSKVMIESKQVVTTSYTYHPLPAAAPQPTPVILLLYLIPQTARMSHVAYTCNFHFRLLGI